MQHHDNNLVKDALDILAKKWKIDPKLYDFQTGKYNDVVDTSIDVGGVIFHIPTLSKDSMYVLWKCLWPDCHNCCDRQGRLPLTKDDIDRIAKKVGYSSKAEFVRKETTISSWQEQEAFGNVITTLSMISLKRKQDEKLEDDGTPLRCRFLDDKGYCSIHPDKPGVCWLYPFASWLEADIRGHPVVHATFQFTGDCPGFYLDESINSMMPILQEYSAKIYNYNMAVSRTTRESYGFINFTDLRGSST
ncbi:MAG: YkgJ family cysteine cluster protein [Thermoproteota archaeon]|nr:YkgJ family cysteine cluster protein [Thermoproteota archaeon]